MDKMPSETAFLRTIRESPEADGPRLVYADWLEEHGETERAEFIRVQIDLSHVEAGDPRRGALQERERELKPAADAWVRSLGGWVRDWEFQRGLLSYVRVMAEDFIRHGPALFERTAVTRVRLTDATTRLARVALSPALPWLRALDIGYNALSAARLQPLTESPNLAGLSALDLSANRLMDDGIRVLSISRHLGNLRTLWLERNGLTSTGIGLLMTARCPHLEQLDLANNGFGPEGVRRLADSRFAESLRVLDLRANEISDSGARALAGSRRLTQLTSLNLAAGNIGDAGAAALANSPKLAALEILDLRYNRLTHLGAQALASSRYLADLKKLFLTGNRVGRTAMRLLRRRFGDRVKVDNDDASVH